MIVYRGIMSILKWDPEKEATPIIRALVDTYVRGGEIRTDSDLVYEKEGLLNISFGRGKGHTTAILDFIDDNEALDICVISHDAAMLQGVAEFDSNPRNRYLSVKEAEQGLRGWIPDVLFVDLSWEDCNRYMSELHGRLCRSVFYSDVPVISMVSDGVHASSVDGPEFFEVEAWSPRFSHLVSGYDIVPAQQKSSAI